MGEGPYQPRACVLCPLVHAPQSMLLRAATHLHAARASLPAARRAPRCVAVQGPQLSFLR